MSLSEGLGTLRLELIFIWQVCATSLCNYRGRIVRGAHLAHKQPQVLRVGEMIRLLDEAERLSSCRFLNCWRGFLFIKSLFRADRGSLGALPVTVILAIQSLSCYRFRPQDYVPDSFVQIKCFGLGCEINLQIPNSPADL